MVSAGVVVEIGYAKDVAVVDAEGEAANNRTVAAVVVGGAALREKSFLGPY
jgi:hypothetical protein